MLRYPVQSLLMIIELLANHEMPRSENSTPPNRGIYFWGVQEQDTEVKFLHTQFQLWQTLSIHLGMYFQNVFLGLLSAGRDTLYACMHRWLNHLQVTLYYITRDYLYGVIQEYTCWHGRWYCTLGVLPSTKLIQKNNNMQWLVFKTRIV
jgi:hypothetical protein